MNKYQKALAVSAAAAMIGFSSVAMADINAEASPSSQIAINYYALDTVINIDENGDSESQTYAATQIQMTDQFKINVATRLEELYDVAADNKDFDWEAAVAQIEAVITVDRENGRPMILVFGKSLERVMKARLESVGRSDASRLQPDELEEVIGVYMDITPEFLDSLTVAVSETEGGDMKFNSDVIRMTVQAEKALSATVDAYGSISYEMNNLTDEDAFAASAGVVIDLESTIGVEGLSAYMQATHYQKGFAGLSEDTWGADIGINYDINETWDLTVGAEKLGDDYLAHLGAEVDLGNGWDAYGSTSFDDNGDWNGVELGFKKVFKKNR